MTYRFLTFILDLTHQTFLNGYFRDELILDDDHAHYRRLTKKYQRKRSIVKLMWCINSFFAVTSGTLAFAVMLFFLSSFLSFSILDETQ